MPEAMLGEMVLLSVNGNKNYKRLHLFLFQNCKGRVPAVGLKCYILTVERSELSASKDYGPSLNVTEVVHGTFRDIIPSEQKDNYEDILDTEGYFVKAETIDPE